MSYTAAEIAAALGMKRQAVQWHLRVEPSTTRKIVKGQEAAAWSFDQLPENLRARLNMERSKQHCRTVEDLLRTPHQRYQPARPIEKIDQRDLQAATKLREALRPLLIRQHDLTTSAAEFDAEGVREYQRVFGNAVSTGYWRELFNRTVRRDNGFEEWNRLEIYLPDRLAPKPAAAGAVVSAAFVEDFAALNDYIAACGNPHSPSEIECRGVWTLALEKIAALVQAGASRKAAARRVCQYLSSSAKFLAPTRNAMRVALNRKLKDFEESGCDVKALHDGRQNNGAHWEFPADDRDLLIHRAVFMYRGDISPAWRDLQQSREFSVETLSRYGHRPANKSYVPTAIRESVAPEVEILTIMYQGSHAFDSIKGHVTRSYDGIHSLQCISGDDFTLNTYFYIPDGEGWFNLTRGQVILFIDFRSLRILGWALEPRRSYSSLTIRSLCTRVFGTFGVPQVLYFERGIWKSAALLKGKTDPFTFSEISQGLREFGVTFNHAIRARTKAVERVGGMFQDIAEGEPGYCGRDERRDAPESLRPQMAEVATRKVHPEKYFYSLDQWNERIGQLVQRYNAEIQQGHILDGLSPDQAFEKYMDPENPPMQFPAGLRYLLAHDKRLLPVTLNGVTIQVGKQKFNYRGSEISHLVGREVLAWFDPENPESIVVTLPDRSNPVCVARSQSPNALESLIAPDSGILAQELSRIEHQASYMKTRFNVVKTKFPLPSRLLLNAAQAEELGAEIDAKKEAVAKAQKQRQSETNQARRLAQRTGIYQPERVRGKVNQDRLRELENFLNPAAPATAAASNVAQGAPVVYKLKPFKKSKDGKDKS